MHSIQANENFTTEGLFMAYGNTQKLHEQILNNLIPVMRYKDGDPQKWQETARVELIHLLGMPEKNCDNKIEVEWTNERYNYSETRFTFESEEGYRPVVHMLLPKGKVRPAPIICLQGHSTGMHISVGIRKYPNDAEDIAGDRDFALQAVAEGYAAFALEQRASGDNGGTEKGPACDHPMYSGLLLGRTLLGERVFDVMRLIDLFESEFSNFIDVDNVGITGNSGGGTVCIYAGAVDERIKVCAPSCAFSSFYASIGLIKHCPCNYIPGIARLFDMGDIAALIAPRPMIIGSGLKDMIFPIAEATEQIEIARKVYAAMNVPEDIKHVIGSEGHRYYRALMWPEINIAMKKQSEYFCRE